MPWCIYVYICLHRQRVGGSICWLVSVYYYKGEEGRHSDFSLPHSEAEAGRDAHRRSCVPPTPTPALPPSASLTAWARGPALSLLLPLPRPLLSLWPEWAKGGVGSGWFPQRSFIAEADAERRLVRCHTSTPTVPSSGDLIYVQPHPNPDPRPFNHPPTTADTPPS